MAVTGRAAGYGHGCKWEKEGRTRGCSREGEGCGWPGPVLVLGQAWCGLGLCWCWDKPGEVVVRSLAWA